MENAHVAFLGPFTRIFTRQAQPAESRSLPFSSLEEKWPSAVFSTTNGWLIGKLRRGKLSKAVLENRFSFFFLNETGTFTLSLHVKRVALESFHEWTPRE